MTFRKVLYRVISPVTASIAVRGILCGLLCGIVAIGFATANLPGESSEVQAVENNQLKATNFQSQGTPSETQQQNGSESNLPRTLTNPFVDAPASPHRFVPATYSPIPEAKESISTPRASIDPQQRQIGNPFAANREAGVSSVDPTRFQQPWPIEIERKVVALPAATPATDSHRQITQVSTFPNDEQLPALVPPIGNSVNEERGLEATTPAPTFVGESGATSSTRQSQVRNQQRTFAPEERIATGNNSYVLPNLDPVNTNSKKVPAKLAAAPLKKQDDQPGDLAGTLGSTKYLLAEQPKAEDQYHDRPPLMSDNAFVVPYSADDFGADPQATTCYDPYAQQQVYQGKSLYANQRPLVELGKPWYQMGQIAPAKLWFGRHNPVSPQFLVYGDFRTGFASNTNNGNQQSVLAMRLNLDFDLRLTSTERFHWFMGPLDRGANFTRVVHDAGETRFVSEFDPDIDFGYFEGDMGAIWGGLANKTLPFDMPFAMGVMPLLFQNGVWLEDEFLGWAATIPARNSPTFDISNMDITFFAGYDKVTSPAFAGDDHDAKIYGMASFIEAAGGYIELDYAFLEDRSQLDRSYHNSSVSYTRRYGRFVSNSIRLINNAGQSPNGIDQTADGTLLLFENSLVSGSPLSFVPYLNGFVGFDRPQSAARNAASGGVLRNTGILFETDGLTGYPTLDATANNTFGGAMGLNIIAKDFSQQLILEAAMVQPFDGAASSANGEQYGLGMRYQLPLSNSIILRCDSMYGLNASDDDVQGYRVELRKKW